MIFTDRTITVQKGASSLDETVILYRGDKGVEIRFTLNEKIPFKFGSGTDSNIIEKTEAAYGQLVIRVPNGLPSIFSEVTATKKGAITFTITAEMIDEITEVGSYTFQIRLLDENKESRVTLPEVVNGIEIREPIASEDTNKAGVATVGNALTTAATTEDVFDSEGNYNETTWQKGDRITDAKLNKIEQGIDGVNRKVSNVDLSNYVTKEQGNANQITFSDGQTFQTKLDAGTLKGDKGDKGDVGPQGPQGIQGPAGTTTASGVSITDTAGNFTATNVEGALQEAGSQIKDKAYKLDSVESLAKIKFKAGDIVFIENYYKHIKNNSQHYRVISENDNGTGIELSDGLFANVLFDNEINITWLGARNSNDYGEIFDIKPYIEKILLIEKTPRIKIPRGYWGISSNNFNQNGIQIYGASEQPTWTFPQVNNTNSTIIFPIEEDQSSVFSFGCDTKEIRGLVFKNINIITNNYKYSGNALTALDTGAKIGLDFNTVTFSKVRDLIISGTNANAQYGIKFNGFETYFSDIMFRTFGKVGSEAKFAFYNYTRETGMYSVPSGMVYENISFEGIGCSWMKLSGVDFHVSKVNGEIDWYSYADGSSDIEVSDLGNDYTPLCLFAVDENTQGCNISNVTVQNLGRLCYIKDGKKYCQDTIIRTDDGWGDFSKFTISNVYCQNSQKDVFAINYLQGDSNADSNGDYPNKTIKSVNNITSDNYRVLFRMKDNNIPRSGYIGTSVKNGLMYNESHKIVNFANNLLLPEDNDIQHAVCFDNDLQTEYMETIRKKYTSIENLIAIFRTNEKLRKGYYEINFKYKVRWVDPLIHMKFVYTDSTESLETFYLIRNDNNYMNNHTYSFYNDIEKDIDKIILTNNNNAYDLRIYSITTRYISKQQNFENINLKGGVVLGDPVSYSLDSLFTNNGRDDRLFKIGFVRSNENGNPINQDCLFLSFDGGSISDTNNGVQILIPIDGECFMLIRNGSNNWVKMTGVSLN